MFNFNGQLKKRSVNLGGGFKQNRNQLLLQTQKERERREQDRLREKSTLTIQRKIRSYIEFIKFKQVLSQNWNSTDANINSRMYHFNLFYSFLFKNNDQRLSQLRSFFEIVNSTDFSSIALFNLNRTYETVVKSLKSLSTKTDEDLEIFTMLLQILKPIHSHITTRKVQCIPVLSKLLLQLSEGPEVSQLSPLLMETIALYSDREPIAYLKFLSNTSIDASHDFKINFASLSCLDTIQDSDLTIDEKLHVLNVVIDQTSIQNMDLSNVTAITLILATLHNVTLITYEERIQNSKMNLQDDVADEDLENGIFHDQKLIGDDLNQTIKKLYSRDFIARAASIFEHELCLISLLYSSLISIKPEWKSNILIFLIPDSFERYLDYVLSNPTFLSYYEISEDKLLSLSTNELGHFFQGDAEIKRFLIRELYTFLEIFQFQLMISNDFELFLNYGFSREKFKALSLFLKKFVLNLIWNESKINKITKSSNEVEYKKLFALISKVLKQLYLKNTRLQIVKAEEWLIISPRFDLNNLVKVIQSYEVCKHESDDFEENGEEEGKDKQIFMDSLNDDNRSKLNIFFKTPFFISFSKRVEIFQNLIDFDKNKLLSSGTMINDFNLFSNFLGQKQKAEIRREHLLEDAYQNFNKIGENFKHELAIVFLNKNGREQGIDGGGITKEFLTSVVDAGFHNSDFFSENASHEVYPNSQISLKYQYRIDSEIQLKNLEYIKFLGKVIGKCLYERVLIDINFAKFFLTKLNKNFQSSFDDLKSYDAELYQNLVKLLQMAPEELESLNLTFTTEERLESGRVIAIDLIPNGALTPVTIANRLKFIHEISNFKLNRVISLQTNAFLNGLYTMIEKSWLHMFNPFELQELIAGEDDVNIQDLYDNTVYGGYSPDDPTIKYFWEVLDEIEGSDKFKLIKFVTSVPRAPLLGFKALVPKFGIRKSENSMSLPTAATCVNLLTLPDYKNKTDLKEKLLYAINAEAGFDLD